MRKHKDTALPIFGGTEGAISAQPSLTSLRVADELIDKKAKRRAYYAKNREKILAQRTARYAANPEKLIARQKAYNDTHKEEVHAYQVAYRASHKEQRHAYYAAHLPENAAYASVRRARIAGSIIGDRAEIAEIYRKAKEDPKVRCYICNKMIRMGDRHVDHIFPVSKGFPTRPSNLAIACSRCNRAKGAKHPNELGMLI